MPEISRFYGIIVKMYFFANEHNPPHVHAYYKEDLAIIEIKSGEIVKGYIPNDQYLIAKRFIDENRNTLLTLWEEDPQDFSRF